MTPPQPQKQLSECCGAEIVDWKCGCCKPKCKNCYSNAVPPESPKPSQPEKCECKRIDLLNDKSGNDHSLAQDEIDKQPILTNPNCSQHGQDQSQLTEEDREWEKEFKRRFSDMPTSALWYVPVREFIREKLIQKDREAEEKVKEAILNERNIWEKHVDRVQGVLTENLAKKFGMVEMQLILDALNESIQQIENPETPKD